MKLQQELKLKQPLASQNHEALLSLVRTSSLMQKLSDRFFSRFGLTDVQFNILMILKEHSNGGLSQQELSEHLIVSKSNVVGLVDRLEKAGYVRREPHPTDRRFNLIVLTEKGVKLEQKIESSYFREVDRLMDVLSHAQKKTLIHAMESIRQYISAQNG
ncbi:MAG TPA: MarR family transcriptional regulator [Blastocatellia bacterium]|nr:MarR family transcriptional regulator [Blastocatellia bacterium]